MEPICFGHVCQGKCAIFSFVVKSHQGKYVWDGSNQVENESGKSSSSGDEEEAHCESREYHEDCEVFLYEESSEEEQNIQNYLNRDQPLSSRNETTNKSDNESSDEHQESVSLSLLVSCFYCLTLATIGLTLCFKMYQSYKQIYPDVPQSGDNFRAQKTLKMR